MLHLFILVRKILDKIMITDIIKIFIPAMASFGVGILITPFLTSILYRRKLWKKRVKSVSLDGSATPIFSKLHADRETSVPRLGGILIWGATAITVVLIWLLAKAFPADFTAKLDFLSRSQTWLPLFALVLGGLVGWVDDILDIRGSGDHIAGGLSLKKRLLIVSLIGLLSAFWFYFKLEVSTIGLPFGGDLEIGWLFIPLFVLITAGIYSGGVVDGLDGLAGGIFASIFAAYAGIAFYQDQINLAAFCATIVGAILAFLWFNIPPARFYMSETGSMALTVALAIVAFMTDSVGEGYGVIILPVVALPLVATTSSVIIQLLSKKFRGKKVFRVAPLHHHFEALGWPAYKITMRYWILSAVCAIIGLVLAMIG